MLVLTRRVGDSIVIGDEIVVTVLEVRSDQVRLGIDAPREVSVHREEVYRQVVEESGGEPSALRNRPRRPPNPGRPRDA